LGGGQADLEMIPNRLTGEMGRVGSCTILSLLNLPHPMARRKYLPLVVLNSLIKDMLQKTLSAKNYALEPAFLMRNGHEMYCRKLIS
jgi:hypothetical protein